MMLFIIIAISTFKCAVLAVETPVKNDVSTLPTTIINPKDGAEMVLIPAGEFLMGTTDDQLTKLLDKTIPHEWYSDQLPQHKVYLDAYYMYKTEVTAEQYRNFCRATQRKMPYRGNMDRWHANDPILRISWYEAKAYSDWYGVSLPTEAQWEKAARGGDDRIFPWGNDWPPPAKSGNFGDESFKNNDPGLEVWTGSIKNYNDSFKELSPVSSFTANPFGIYDIAGNVPEWCSDWYSKDYYNKTTENNPTGPLIGKTKVCRGSSFVSSNKINLSCSYRYGKANPTEKSCGFRCVISGVDYKKLLAPIIMQPVSSLPKKKINPKDGMEMVLIPAGEFIMGTPEEKLKPLLKDKPEDFLEWYMSESPQHKVYLGDFYMSKNKVNVVQYRKFCKATNRKMPPEPPWKWQDNHPIVNITWDEAEDYAFWSGGMLPTEAQWEKAAQGGDKRTYPWGNSWPPPTKAGNFGDKTLKHYDHNYVMIKNYIDGFIYTSPVASFMPNPYGVYDLAGNAKEWCYDDFDTNYYKKSPLVNPIGPFGSTMDYTKVLRGSSWVDTDSVALRVSYRNAYFGKERVDSIGFRCVYFADKP